MNVPERAVAQGGAEPVDGSAERAPVWTRRDRVFVRGVWALVVVWLAAVLTLAASSRSASDPAVAAVLGRWAVVVLAIGAVPLLAVVWLVELIRRGTALSRPAAGGGARAVGVRHAQGAYVTRLAPVDERWRRALGALAGLGGLALLVVAVRAGHAAGYDEALAAVLTVGFVAVGIGGAVAGSAVKRAAYLRAVASGRAPEPRQATATVGAPRGSAVAAAVTPRRGDSPAVRAWKERRRATLTAAADGAVRPTRSTRFWRFITYRWFVDLWVCALGAIVVGLGLAVALGGAGGAGTGVLVVAGGVLVWAGGAALAAQFWRADENLWTVEGL